LGSFEVCWDETWLDIKQNPFLRRYSLLAEILPDIGAKQPMIKGGLMIGSLQILL